MAEETFALYHISLTLVSCTHPPFTVVSDGNQVAESEAVALSVDSQFDFFFCDLSVL